MQSYSEYDFIPLFERVLVRLDPPTVLSDSGLILPKDSTEPTQTGTVVEAGKTALEHVQPNDIIFIQKYAGTPLNWNGEDLLLIMVNDVLGVLRKKRTT